MKHLSKIVLIAVFLFVSGGFTIKRLDYTEGRMNNVCKSFSNKVLAYFIFVDSKETFPWTQYDIQSTIDSIEVAIQWLEDQAKESGINLNIILDYYIGNEYTTVKKNLPMGSIIETISEPNLKKGLAELNYWADGIAKKVGASFNIEEKDGIPDIKNPRDKERLISYLRDQNQVESVALVYMVNNYFKDDISIPVNIYNTNDVEFAVVSYKYPTVLAHNVLHLFGASDLFKTPYRTNEKKIKLAAEILPNSIMHDMYGKSLNEVEICDFTRYLIGWDNKINEKYNELLTDKIINF